MSRSLDSVTMRFKSVNARRNLVCLLTLQFVLIIYVFSPVYISPFVYQGIGTTGLSRWSGLNNTTIPWLSSPLLPRVLDLEEHQQYLQLLENMDRLLKRYNVTYALFYGILLGSYMMHDLIPWDSDVDVVVRLQDMETLSWLVENKEHLHEFNLLAFWHNTPRTRSIKLCFYEGGHSAGIAPWTWPFIDLQFYGENETHVWNTDPPGSGFMVFSRDVFYPLQRRPVGSLWLPTPRMTRVVLREKYGDVFKCIRGAWNHKHEIPYWSLLYTPCAALLDIYPFVERRVKEGFTEETLTLAKRKLYSITLKDYDNTDLNTNCKFCI